MSGKLEEEMRSEVRLTKVRQAILSSLALTGMTAIAVMAPNTLQLLGKVIDKSGKSNIRSAAKKLAERGLISFDAKMGTVEITRKGVGYLERIEHARTPIKKPYRWDHKWRIIIFDIPETRARQRKDLSHTLKRIGLYRLQDSVWVHPYDCEELIGLLKADYRLASEVQYIIADKIERDDTLKKHFGIR